MTTAAGTEKTVDVVIVGAGLSGLQAARRVQAAGLSCAILEAEARVGGKTLTVRSAEENSGFNDLGAAWINDSSQSEVYGLAKELGMTLEVQRTEGMDLSEGEDGRVVASPSGKVPLGEDDAAALQRFVEIVEKATEKVELEDPQNSPDAGELDGITMAEFWKKHSGNDAVKGMLDIAIRGLLGVEADEVSALYFLSYCRSNTGLENLLSSHKHGGQYLRAREGMQTLSHGLAAQLHPNTIHLSTPVTSITQGANLTTIHTSTPLTLHAKKVIVSISTPLYPTITFSPPLPPPKRTLAAHSALGYYTKVILIYAHPWWRAANLSGAFRSTLPPAPISFGLDTSIAADGQWSLTCFAVGAPGRRWSALPTAEAREGAVVEQVRRVFAGELGGRVPAPVRVVEMEWAREEWFRGAPVPVTGLGVLVGWGGALRERVGGVHFVGTETASVWKGYLDGAVRSGKRGAEEVVEALEG